MVRDALLTARRLFDERQIAEALGCYMASGCDPSEDALERWMCHMLLGDFESAWRSTDRLQQYGPPECRLLWNGASFDGADVVIRCEHGLGDTLQFIRYAALLRPRCRTITVAAQPDLISLLRTMPEIDRVSAPGEASLANGVAIECMEMAYAFRTTLETIPARVPYLGAELLRTPGNGPLRVGLVWASGLWNPDRSIPLEKLAPLAAIPNLAFFSLQHGPAWREALCSPLPFVNPAEPVDSQACTTAAQIAALDLVITVDTMVAHLSGALGQPVWVLLPYAADWRWLLAREDSPWYPTMRLFRQASPGNWNEVVQRLCRALRDFTPTRSCREVCESDRRTPS